MRERKYQHPKFLKQVKYKISQEDYEKWLQRKAKSLARRDRKYFERRGKELKIVVVEYKMAIHKAVCECKEKDVYTGEALDWSLLSKWDNEEARKRGREYKQAFALLPSVDHVSGLGVADFKICSWRTNDAKNDLSLDEFVALCKKVVEHNK